MTSKRSYVPFVLLSLVLLLTSHIVKSPSILNSSIKKSLGYSRDSLSNFTEVSYNHGYLSEEHNVVTEDGYILKMFRIESRKCRRKRNPPVILMHGLLQSSDVWLDAGPGSGLAYLLADECYDLWVGNQRGNYYGRSHTTLDPNSEKFWQFSVDEIGYYDIPATIDYVLEKTGEVKVNYIGFSQGASTFYIMCSERKGYCDKVNFKIGLAPAARQTHTKSVVYKSFSSIMEKLSSILSLVGIYEIFPKGAISQEFLAFVCHFHSMSNSVCDMFASMVDAKHPGSITNDTLRVLYGHFPAGTSLQNIIRYSQSMKSDKFEKFDYGFEQNMKVYGMEHPPEYNLKAVIVPVVILYGSNDHLVDPKDVRWLVNELPNVLDVIQVKDAMWNHFDVAYSRYVSELLFPKVNEYLLKFSSLKN